MLACMIPVEILSKRMSALYHVRPIEWHTERRDASKSESYDLWQRSCDESTKGRWTHISVYLQRK